MNPEAEAELRRRVKAEIRKRMRGLRNTMPESAAAERSAAIVANLEAMPEVQSARVVASFWPMLDRREVDLRALDARLRARGARVAYPLLADDGSMEFRLVADAGTMIDRGRGFAEPSDDDPSAAPGELEVIVAPALAVDPRGYRLGYGAGFYDRALPVYAPPAVTIAVAYDFQLVAELPAEPFDARAAWVVTDKRVIRASE